MPGLRRLHRACRGLAPRLDRVIDGREMLAWVERIVSTDRWVSFERFAETSRYLAAEFERHAAAEVHSIQTGEAMGSGRWTIPEAFDVVRAVADVIAPVRERVVDYHANPWQIVKWSSSTPRDGLTLDLVAVDSAEELDRLPRGALVGKAVLNRAALTGRPRDWADRGAGVVLFDPVTKNHPEATKWLGWGWAGVAHAQGAARPVGLVLPSTVGDRLRRLLRDGPVRLHVDVETRRYVGAHEVVSGIVRGVDRDSEIWAIAHDMEPGAADNASGVALCLAAAAGLERLIAAGELPRPKRTIRLLCAYECYGFFAYLEQVRRYDTPLAGVCVDCVGMRPDRCAGRLEWHDTIPMSAAFVETVGEVALRHALRVRNPGYRLYRQPFVSTSDTLIGDPKVGFPCPWIATLRPKQPLYDEYHSSADTIDVLSPDGLAACAVGVASYLYHLADMGTDDVHELAEHVTARTLAEIAGAGRIRADYLADRHHESLRRLRRWWWGGDHAALAGGFAERVARVREAAVARGRRRGRRAPGDGRVPRRIAPLAPTLENTPGAIADRIRATGLPAWALFWADGERDLREIAERLTAEHGRPAEPAKVAEFFEAHAALGYVELVEPEDIVDRRRLVDDLRALGLRPGMDVMVHSSLSAIGHVAGGADTVVDALLAVVGSRGTVLAPSFNHGAVTLFNPLTTSTSNGAIPDALWRRPEALRSVHATHAVAAIGARAVWYTAGHLEAGVWGQDSPIGRLVHHGGWILSIGVGHHATTAYHVAENAVGCGCIDPFGNRDRVVTASGEVVEVAGLAWRSETCPVSPSRLDELLDARGAQHHGQVGRAKATLVEAIEVWRARCEDLAEVCPTCPIRPEYRSSGS